MLSMAPKEGATHPRDTVTVTLLQGGTDKATKPPWPQGAPCSSWPLSHALGTPVSTGRMVMMEGVEKPQALQGDTTSVLHGARGHIPASSTASLGSSRALAPLTSTSRGVYLGNKS